MCWSLPTWCSVAKQISVLSLQAPFPRQFLNLSYSHVLCVVLPHTAAVPSITWSVPYSGRVWTHWVWGRYLSNQPRQVSTPYWPRRPHVSGESGSSHPATCPRPLVACADKLCRSVGWSASVGPAGWIAQPTQKLDGNLCAVSWIKLHHFWLLFWKWAATTQYFLL